MVTAAQTSGRDCGVKAGQVRPPPVVDVTIAVQHDNILATEEGWFSDAQ